MENKKGHVKFWQMVKTTHKLRYASTQVLEQYTLSFKYSFLSLSLGKRLNGSCKRHR